MVLTFGQWINNQDTPSVADTDATTGTTTTTTIEVENPTDGTTVGIVPAGTAADAAAALQSAQAAAPAWAKTPVSVRATLLRGLATIVRQHRAALAETLVQEQAKMASLAAIEVDAVATYFEFYAGLAYTGFEGEIVPSDNVGEHIYVHYLPIGVAVGIVPWNFPFFVVCFGVVSCQGTKRVFFCCCQIPHIFLPYCLLSFFLHRWHERWLRLFSQAALSW